MVVYTVYMAFRKFCFEELGLQEYAWKSPHYSSKFPGVRIYVVWTLGSGNKGGSEGQAYLKEDQNKKRLEVIDGLRPRPEVRGWKIHHCEI